MNEEQKKEIHKDVMINNKEIYYLLTSELTDKLEEYVYNKLSQAVSEERERIIEEIKSHGVVTRSRNGATILSINWDRLDHIEWGDKLEELKSNK